MSAAGQMGGMNFVAGHKVLVPSGGPPPVPPKGLRSPKRPVLYLPISQAYLRNYNLKVKPLAPFQRRSHFWDIPTKIIQMHVLLTICISGFVRNR